MTITALSPAERADQLLAMTKRLVVLIKAEIEALKARRLDGASTDWDEKERLAHTWRLEVAHIKANPAALAGIGEPKKTELREAARELEDAVEVHARSLAAMKDVTEGLVRSIASEIAASRAAPKGYGRSGAISDATNRDGAGLTVNAKA